MKHTWKITAILLAMFLATQFIGLFVVKSYSPRQAVFYNETSGQYENMTIKTELPYGLEPPPTEPQTSFISIVIAMIIAILLIFFLMKLGAAIFLRLWFFAVVIIAIAITSNAALSYFIGYPAIMAFIIALPLAFYKIFKRNLIVHNITELLIYPGIAAIFVPLLNLFTIVLLLLLISAYDIYAVWYSKFMQNMAKFQINELKLFSGFFVPYLSKKQREELKKAKAQSARAKTKKMKVSLAILGGGDVIFPIITAGIEMRAFGLFSALLISVVATLALLYLFVVARKGKFYPAMPFLTVGLLAGMAVVYLINLL